MNSLVTHLLMPIVVDLFDTVGVKTGGAANDTMHNITLQTYNPLYNTLQITLRFLLFHSTILTYTSIKLSGLLLRY